MDKIIRGTTPSIKYTFSTVDVSTISIAYLTIKIGKEVVIEKDLTSATIGSDYILWTLSQEESLQLDSKEAKVMLNWKTSDGVRGAGEEKSITIVPNHKEVVI